MTEQAAHRASFSIRRELLALCDRASIIITIIVFVLLPFQFLYAPPQ